MQKLAYESCILFFSSKKKFIVVNKIIDLVGHDSRVVGTLIDTVG